MNLNEFIKRRHLFVKSSSSYPSSRYIARLPELFSYDTRNGNSVLTFASKYDIILTSF